jgi:hypothetical protein
MYSLFEDLKAAIGGQANRRPLIICGAGTSIFTSRGRAPGWAALIADAIARLQTLDTTGCPALDGRQVQKMDTAALISLADAVTSRFGGVHNAEFGQWLEGSVGHLPASEPELIEVIASLGCPIATTNYDDLISRITHRREINWSDHSAMLRVLNDEPDFGVIHLHGHWRDPGHVVLGSRSYAAHSADERRDFIQKMAALQRPTVFVGCSHEGLHDPDLGRLSIWIAGMNNLVQRRYWLVTDGDLRQADPASRTYCLSYGARHADLPTFLRRLIPSSPDALPADPWMIGRSSHLETLVSSILAGERVMIIPGGPGIGKTTLALAAAHSSSLRDSYAERRYFVSLDSRRSAYDLLTGVCLSLRLPATGGVDSLLRALISACETSPRLVILDNFETPLERDTRAVEDTLARLAEIPGLSLIVTVRGMTPGLAVARVLPDVHALHLNEARELFLRWAPAIDAMDRDLEPLLLALDGHALSVVLLARLAQGQTSLSLLRAAYERERVNLLKSGSADHRLLSTRVSLRLSLQSPLMTQAAVGAIDLLSYSPGGLRQKDLEESLDVLPDDFYAGALALLNLRLIEQRGDRLYMLAPLREAVIEEIADGLL